MGALSGQVIAITGANSGIGKAAALTLAREGATVVVAARDPRRGAAAVEEIRHLAGADTTHFLRLDLADLGSIEGFARDLQERFDRLDVLINNAGAVLTERQLTADGFEATFGVNHLGHFHLTNVLSGMLRESAPARVVNVASVAHRFAVRGMPFEDLQAERRYVSWHVYGCSKLANLLHAAEVARRWEGTGVTAYSCHPGTIRSGFGGPDDTTGFDRVLMAAGHPFLRSPEHGARVLVHLASAERSRLRNGGYWVGRQRRRPSRHGRSPVQAERLWNESEHLIASAGH